MHAAIQQVCTFTCEYSDEISRRTIEGPITRWCGGHLSPHLYGTRYGGLKVIRHARACFWTSGSLCISSCNQVSHHQWCNQVSHHQWCTCSLHHKRSLPTTSHQPSYKAATTLPADRMPWGSWTLKRCPKWPAKSCKEKCPYTINPLPIPSPLTSLPLVFLFQ